MPLIIHKVRGRPTGLFMALLAPGATAAPATVNIAVAAGGAAVGAVAIPVTALPAAVPRNTILTFSRAAGNPSSLTVVTRENAAMGATSLPVEMLEGDGGAPLEHSLAAADAAVWDQLLTVPGTEDAPFTNNPSIQTLSAVTYGSATGTTVTLPEVTTISPQIARTGLFLAEGQLIRDLITHGDTNREWWVRQTIPNATGALWATRTGRAKVTDLNETRPAAELIRLAFNIRFVTRPAITYAAPV